MAEAGSLDNQRKVVESQQMSLSCDWHFIADSLNHPEALNLNPSGALTRSKQTLSIICSSRPDSGCNSNRKLTIIVMAPCCVDRGAGRSEEPAGHWSNNQFPQGALGSSGGQRPPVPHLLRPCVRRRRGHGETLDLTSCASSQASYYFSMSKSLHEEEEHLQVSCWSICGSFCGL